MTSTASLTKNHRSDHHRGTQFCGQGDPSHSEKTLSEWEEELADMDVCWGRIQNLSEVLQDPLFREREMVVEVLGKEGTKTPAIGVPVKLSDTPSSVRTPPVGFGESTTAILQELGYPEEKIKQLRDKNVI